MANKQVFPTKGNLLALQKSVKLAQLGYELMDKKRNILIREMMEQIEKVRSLRDEIADIFKKAYFTLQEANITLGVIEDIAKAIPIDNHLDITYRSVMGVEIPKVLYNHEKVSLRYGISNTNTKFDYAYKSFLKVRDLILILAEVDNALYRLADAIRKSRKRANALKNIVIPDYKTKIKFISDTLEEREREEFSRRKIIKSNQENK
ncbi:V-type ATP synthase subunit D [Hujiaoplasma nucleasis]|uniref:V-type ATP synthase subunit D n=1 Tax=Hujiaoplasma nucleasis TaxID=2725268 RepID=A0A7L6N7P7_9MOLU|nr:V-type ATP synthase subunit D [Hujiaoplasma nucleasis]QLY40564.1 V-type ATP synthase subunit D [Hujiaoplasma nucleasis]